MSVYFMVNKEAQIYKRPTTKLESSKIQELVQKSKEEQEEELPPTVRYNYGKETFVETA